MVLSMAMAMLAAASAIQATDHEAESGVQSMVNEETPDVFLAKATLQQYLSRVVRKDWDGARRLTHLKTLSDIAAMKKRTGREINNLAPWANSEIQLKTFKFGGARQSSPGVVLISVGEDNYHAEEQGMSTDDPAVYVLFKSHGSWVVGDKKASVELADVTDDSIRIGYPGWVDHQSVAQARREAPAARHR